MLNRTLVLAAVAACIGSLSPGGLASPAMAQNLEAGKSPSQIFAATCSLCHKSTRGLLKTVAPGSLPSFLRQHYTTSQEMAAGLSAYVLSNGASDRRIGGDDNLTREGKDSRALPNTGEPDAGRKDKRGRREANKPEPAPAPAPAPEDQSLIPRFFDVFKPKEPEQPAQVNQDSPREHGKRDKHKPKRAVERSERPRDSGSKPEAGSAESKPASAPQQSEAPAARPAASSVPPPSAAPDAARGEGERPDPVPAATPAPRSDSSPEPAPASSPAPAPAPHSEAAAPKPAEGNADAAPKATEDKPAAPTQQ